MLGAVVALEAQRVLVRDTSIRQWRARVRGQRRTGRSVHYPYPLARQRPRRQGIQPDFGW